MKISQVKRGAFTLIELLVVITIIAILAGIALPVFNSVTEKGAQTKALSNAKQIGLACKLFSGDNDGNFPQTGTKETPTFGTAPGNANIAYKLLVPEYVPSENIFYIAKSKWSPNAPDENVTDAAATLKAGENHWAYVPLLTDTSNPNFPLIADGFAEGTPGTYAKDPTVKGGVWSGKKAIIIKADQSGSIEKVSPTDLKVKASTGGATKADMFAVAAGWIPSAPVNPE